MPRPRNVRPGCRCRCACARLREFLVTGCARGKFYRPRIDLAAPAARLGRNYGGSVRKGLHRLDKPGVEVLPVFNRRLRPRRPDEHDDFAFRRRSANTIDARSGKSPRRTVSKYFVSSRAIAASRGPRTAAKSFNVSATRRGESKKPGSRGLPKVQRCGCASQRSFAAEILRKRTGRWADPPMPTTITSVYSPSLRKRAS